MEYLVLALAAATALILIIGLMIDDKPNTSGKFDGWQ